MNLVILTGAGISKPSGISTYRDAGGIWTFISEDKGTIDYFRANRQSGQESTNNRRWEYRSKKPNDAHLALAVLQQEWYLQERGHFTLVTQNIDGLHEKAGSANPIHMHGEIGKIRHEITGQVLNFSGRLEASSRYRPHTVFFDENVLHHSEIEEVVEHADLFIAIGTSGEVIPASNYAARVVNRGGRSVCINMEMPHNSNSFDEILLGDATDILPRYSRFLLDHGLEEKIEPFPHNFDRRLDLSRLKQGAAR